jgi:hypothetical protein
MKENENIENEFCLGDERKCVISLPNDLTYLEVKRLEKFLYSLVID